MASISSLVSYGGSDSESEEEETRGGGVAKETAVSSKRTGGAGLIKHHKDKTGRVKVYLPELNQTTRSTDKVCGQPHCIFQYLMTPYCGSGTYLTLLYVHREMRHCHQLQ